MCDMLDRIYAAQEQYEQRLADAERARRYSRSAVRSGRHSGLLRHLLIALGNLLIDLGMRLKAMPPAVCCDEPAAEIIR